MPTSGVGIDVHAQVRTSTHRHFTHIKYTNTAGGRGGGGRGEEMVKGEKRRRGGKEGREGGERKRGGKERRGEEEGEGREGRGGQERKRLFKNLYWLKISKIAQNKTQIFEETSNRIKTKQSTPKHISVEFLSLFLVFIYLFIS